MSIDLKRLIQKIIPHDAVNVYVTVWKIYKKKPPHAVKFESVFNSIKTIC